MERQEEESFMPLLVFFRNADEGNGFLEKFLFSQ